MIASRLGVSDDWIERRTGIRSRHIAEPEERLTTHATRAAVRALDRAGVSAEELDLVLVATTTADELLPNAAPLVAHELGATGAGAFDIGAACTGFLSALAVGAAQIEAGRASRVVVVGADFMSRITDPEDRSTAAVFADGAGAVVMVASEQAGGIGPVVLGADGAGADHIVVKRSESLIRMQGHETFREAVARLTLATLQAAHAAGVSLEEIDLFVYHQANGRILSAVGERLGLPAERVVDCIGEYGNTSAATLPLALAFSESEGRLAAGDRVLLGAFGAGFTWGATIVEWGAPA
jgi:3-oxoacyl-[acyl-carrier-protein] synthase-3